MQHWLQQTSRRMCSNSEPPAFIAQPAVHCVEVEIIVALQLPSDAINAITSARTGMVETGETYFAGADKLVHFDSLLEVNGRR